MISNVSDYSAQSSEKQTKARRQSDNIFLQRTNEPSRDGIWQSCGRYPIRETQFTDITDYLYFAWLSRQPQRTSISLAIVNSLIKSHSRSISCRRRDTFSMHYFLFLATNFCDNITVVSTYVTRTSLIDSFRQFQNFEKSETFIFIAYNL